jgi:hypothetical protein
MSRILVLITVFASSLALAGDERPRLINSRRSGSSSSGSASASSGSCSSPSAEGVQSLGGGSYAIDDDLMARYRNNPDAASSLARASWGHNRSGDRNGIKIRSISCSSPAYAAGLRKGDLVTAINGRSVAGSAAAMTAWQLAKNDDVIVVSLRRGGSSTALRYEVRDLDGK